MLKIDSSDNNNYADNFVNTLTQGITTVVIEAESPRSLPVMECTYSIQVRNII